MRFEVLGPLQVADDGEYLVLGPPQQQKLLAVLLASRNAPLTIDRLIDELWGEEPPHTARHLVHVYVSRLRSILDTDDGDQRIETTGSGYVLVVRPGELDSDDLESLIAAASDISPTTPDEATRLLQEATALWKDRPFGELADESNLLRAETARLTETYLRAMEQRIDLDLDLGRHEATIGELESLTTDHPYRERFWAQRMLALYRSGRQSEALRAYERVRTTLIEDLGIEPGPELSQLELQILLHDPELEWDPPALTNIPSALTTMIGREEEIDGIADALSRARLVTLAGVAGVGKTRLAIATAEHLQSHYPDGSWWIDLARINDPSDVDGALADVVGVMPQAGAPLIDSITRSFARKRTLIVLDNCEHLIPGVRDTVSALLMHSPRTSVLTTSRVPLKAAGEHVWRVAPLPVDTATDAPSAAAQLFSERATEADHRFEITSLNQDTIASICSAVDGIPLAIEVAAARARALTPDQILALLEHPLSALAERSSSSSRHPTVKAALDWSYDLLERDLQIVLDRLSVFPAEFDVDGMEAVACRPPVEASPIDAITELVDASVVFVMGKESGVARYRLPVIIRDYGSLHLKDSSNEVDVGNAHARYVFDVILRAGDTISSPGFADWIPILVALTPDIRTALDWSLSRWTRAESLVVARTLMHFWYRTGNPVDAIKWGRRMLDDISGVPNHLVAAARNCVGFGANVLGDADEALFQMDGAVALLRDGDHPRLLINALWGRGHVALQVGDVSTAHRCATEALALGDEIGDPWLRADPLSLLGFALFFSGQSLHDARRYSEEAQALYRELGDTASQSVMNPLSAIAVRQGDFASAERYALDVAALAVGTGWEGAALVNLADVFYEQGRIDEATTTLERGVLRSLDAGLENWFRIALRDLARIAVRRRDGRRAALLIGASRRNMPVYGLDPTIHEPIDAFCRSVLGDGEFTLATAEGRDMGYERLMELAIAGSHARVDAT